MPQQLSFDLPVSVALGADDYFVAPANAQAFAMVREPQSWPDGKLALIGPKGSGKSHLAQVWAQQSGAEVHSAGTLEGLMDLPRPGAAVIVEDMEHLRSVGEEYLFHLHNHLRATNGHLLLTAQTPPSRWSIALPDLASRMQAATVVQISEPDDDLLRVVLLKHFADRQIMPAPDVISYVTGRMERSFAAAAEIAAALDTAALSRKSAITRPIAREVLDIIAAKQQDTPSP